MKGNEKQGREARAAFRPGRLVASLLGLCILGGLMIFSFQNALNRTTAEISNTEELPEDTGHISVSENIPVTDSRSQEDSPADEGQTNENTGAGAISVMPAEGTILRDYSGNGLSYSKTLNQYLAHKAVDIAAAEGSPVVAAESGTVISAGTDDRYGRTVVIAHGDGLETSYGNLDEISVAEGDVVNKGDTVGTVGTSALFESEDEPHLHFSVHRNGEAEDPHEIWNW